MTIRPYIAAAAGVAIVSIAGITVTVSRKGQLLAGDDQPSVTAPTAVPVLQTAPQIPQPDDWQVFSDPNIHLAFAYPAHWHMATNTSEGRIVLTAGEDEVKAILTLHSLPANADAKEWTNQRLSEAEATITSRVQVVINGELLIKTFQREESSPGFYKVYRSLAGNRVVEIEWLEDDATLNEFIKSITHI